ncbi:uncharacterized protein K460DRAFT_100243 [Cucurbitaria berberidis CBS 394.84]|uniref:Uncharacterized protein n=1 Tax=Cucurbitaria berberidis CBS 394.84 TaxID=1168544 RepID=A0A9P4L7F3_9PLEO|nr:uncharacterized protein K460DRAFT_100243 [Cucurbitaria berberidis CBS 394.84]KAF1844895.1 hypothetical protein K460DRAFT_100243 [Cucurbitaria berberidis CBS 394.84]
MQTPDLPPANSPFPSLRRPASSPIQSPLLLTFIPHHQLNRQHAKNHVLHPTIFFPRYRRHAQQILYCYLVIKLDFTGRCRKMSTPMAFAKVSRGLGWGDLNSHVGKVYIGRRTVWSTELAGLFLSLTLNLLLRTDFQDTDPYCPSLNALDTR